MDMPKCNECQSSYAKFICESCNKHICEHCQRDGKCLSCV